MKQRQYNKPLINEEIHGVSVAKPLITVTNEFSVTYISWWRLAQYAGKQGTVSESCQLLHFVFWVFLKYVLLPTVFFNADNRHLKDSLAY